MGLAAVARPLQGLRRTAFWRNSEYPAGVGRASRSHGNARPQTSRSPRTQQPGLRSCRSLWRSEHWEHSAKGRLTATGYVLHLDVEAAARLSALAEMYPKRRPEELLGELLGAALEELEASFPYVKGQKVIATDEEDNPLYEDIGPTPRFLALSRRHLHDLSAAAGKQKH